MDAHEDTRRIQVLSVSDTGRRRRWTDDEKVRIVEESHGDGEHWRRSHGAMTFRDHSFTIGDIGTRMGCLGLAHNFCAFFSSKTVLALMMFLRRKLLS